MEEDGNGVERPAVGLAARGSARRTAVSVSVLRLLDAGRPVSLTLVGDGPLRAALEQRVRDSALAGRVRVEAFSGRYWPPRFVGARRLDTAP